MKITVMGTSGRIGTHLVDRFEEAGVEVVAASTSMAVDSVTWKVSEQR
jgi:nucleoside-diphosphate-sugar epimerase